MCNLQRDHRVVMGRRTGHKGTVTQRRERGKSGNEFYSLDALDMARAMHKWGGWDDNVHFRVTKGGGRRRRGNSFGESRVHYRLEKQSIGRMVRWRGWQVDVWNMDRFLNFNNQATRIDTRDAVSGFYSVWCLVNITHMQNRIFITEFCFFFWIGR